MSQASSSTGPSVQALFPPLHVPPSPVQQEEPAHKVDETCFSFCTQRSSQRVHGIEPMCSMICWRRRPPVKAKRPIKAKDAPYPWSPFELLRHWAEQRSIVYVRGTPNGVYGCYLEEMTEVAGSLSGLKRGKEQEYYSKQWGDEGSIVQLPLSVVLSPFIRFPQHLKTVVTPPVNLVKSYTESFTSGAQRNALDKFWEEVQRGGALKVADKGLKHWVKRSQDGQPPKDGPGGERRGPESPNES